MLEAIGDNTEGERLNLSFRILLSGTIGEDTWQFSHLIQRPSSSCSISMLNVIMRLYYAVPGDCTTRS